MMKPAAQKSRGEYKAVILHIEGGRTRREILGKRSRPLIWRGREPLPGGPTHFVRGKTFATRDAALDAARRSIALREERMRQARERFERAQAAVKKNWRRVVS